MYVYQLINGESKVKKLEFVKPTKSIPEMPTKPQSEIKTKINDKAEIKTKVSDEEEKEELEGPNPSNASPMVAENNVKRKKV